MDTRQKVNNYKAESLRLKNAISRLLPELEAMPLMDEVLKRLISDGVFKLEQYERLTRTEKFEGGTTHNRDLLLHVMAGNHELKFLEILETLPEFEIAVSNIRRKVQLMSVTVKQEDNGVEEDVADGSAANGDISLNKSRKRQWGGIVKAIECHPHHYTGIRTSSTKYSRYFRFWAQEKSGEIQQVVAVETVGSEEYLEQLEAVITDCIDSSCGLSFDKYTVGKTKDDNLPSAVFLSKISNLTKMRRIPFKRILLNFKVDQIRDWPLHVGERIDMVATVRNIKKSSSNKVLDNEVKRQDMLIGDSTGIIKLVIFGEYVDQLEEGKSYAFEHLCLFGSKPEQRHLKTGKEKTKINPRLGVKPEPLTKITDEEADKLLKSTEVCGVIHQVERVYIYPYCPNHNLFHYELEKQESAPNLGHCPQCECMHHLKDVKNAVVTNIIFKGNENMYKIALFRDNVELMAQLLGKELVLADLKNEKKVEKNIKIMLMSELRFAMETRDSPRGGLVVDGNQINLDTGDNLIEVIETAMRKCEIK